MTSITDIDNLVSELQEAKLPAIRTGAHPSRASQLYGLYGSRFRVGKDNL
jgi:hypothetical protein